MKNLLLFLLLTRFLAAQAPYPVGSNADTEGFDLEACSNCSVMYSYSDRLLNPGQESHAVQLGYAVTVKVAHNWFEGNSSGTFCNGYQEPLANLGVMLCQDVEDRGNRYTYPYSWMVAFQNGFKPNNGSNGYVRKNASEIKSAYRYVRDGNIYENVDNSGAQNGTAFTAKVAIGSLSANNYWLSTTNLTMTNNIYRQTCNGPSFGEGGDLSSGGVTLGVQQILFQNNLGYNVGNFVPGGCSGTTPSYAIRIGPSAIAWSCTASSSATLNGDGTTAITVVCASESGGVVLDQSNGDPAVVAGCSDSTFNTTTTQIGPAVYGTTPFSLTFSYNLAGATAGESGVSCTTVTGPGKPYFTSLLHNTFVAQEAGPAPAVGIYDSYATSVSGLPNPAPYYYMRNQTIQNNLFATYGVFTSGTQGFYDQQGMGTRAESTSRDINTFAFNNNAFPSAGLQGVVNCVLATTDTCTLVSGNAPNAQARMAGEYVVVNGVKYGPVSSATSTTLVLPSTSNPGTVSGGVYSWADYTEYGGAYNGLQPPVTDTFPAGVACSTTSPNTIINSVPGCIGMVGAMSTANYPVDLSDWHGYALCHSGNAACNNNASLYAAGGTYQATDGTDLGASVTAIDVAETRNIYLCATACGLTGPYPDSLAPAAAASFFGFSENNTNIGGWPTVSYGMQRFWDSPSLQWPDINTASGVFTFSSLDSDLALAYSNGAMEGMYTLSRTPTWASSDPTDTSCNYTTGMGGGDGECDAPSDLNSDGSGANAIWKAWVTAIATHVNSPGYTATHAHIKYWEIWNEPDSKPFWAGSIAQLARLTEDANCIITGRGVIHQSGNGVATPCTATAIDPTAQIVMASAHAKGVALVYGQNELYCNNTSGVPSYELPCPNPPNAIASAVDIINFHMKPGNESGNNCPAPTPCTPESAMQWYFANIHSILQPAELAKPLWDGEAQYSSTGFINTYSDPDMAASFMPRFYLLNWTLGLDGMAWYYASSQAEPAQAETSYQQTYNWLANASLVTPCAASGTVWSCTIQSRGTQYLIMWDTSQSCSNGSCTTGNQAVALRWTQYQDMTSASSPIAISGHSVPVGIKAVVLH